MGQTAVSGVPLSHGAGHGCVRSIIEDDESIREMLRYYFRSVGYEVGCFESGEAYFETGGELKPSLFILDIMLPGMDGLEIDPIWEGSNEAAQTIGDADARFVLQGRDENKGQLRPSEYSILLGQTEEVLVRPAS